MREPARRGCDLCGLTSFDELYPQRFATFDDGSTFGGYEVVACRRCGFVFAEGIAGAEAFERYYRELSKYESHESEGFISDVAAENHRSIVRELATVLPDRSIAILDVGCANGHLLHCFLEAGYSNVTGFDPSPRCAEIASTRYGIRVSNTPLSKMGLAGQRYDLVLLDGVLEHLRDLRPSVAQLVEVVSPEGMIWFEVPDAARFASYASSPFQQFSLEHINFFTAKTLTALMATFDFVDHHVVSTARALNGGIEDPALDGLYRRGASAGRPITRDDDGVASVRNYIAASAALERRLTTSLEHLAATQEPVMIWGAGTLALHLLKSSILGRLAIVAFVDNNKNYHGKTIDGVPILSPHAIGDRRERIIVISRSFEAEILTGIRNRYGLRNDVTLLFGNSPIDSTTAFV